MLESFFNKVASLQSASFLKSEVKFAKLLWAPIFWKTSANDCFRKCFIKKSVLKNFAHFTEKHLRWSLFLIKWQVSSLQVFWKVKWSLRNFCDIQKTKVAVDKFSVKKVFLVVDRAVKVKCIKRNLYWSTSLVKKCTWLNELFFP